MKDGLPTGTLTFLFTDVEGSTRTLTEVGAERFAEALAEHQGLIRQTVAEHGGMEVDTHGDAFFCVFASARAAVACAEQAQQRLAATLIRVRMGLHSGEALVVDDHYVGLDVHRAARVAAAGHGGQVLLSSTTVGLLEAGAFKVHDLGEHRLKDLSAPLRLWQLGDASFPALKTLHRTNLPIPATPFLGRRREVESVLAEAAADSARLLTLTGPGGTGKTRLALQIAAELADDFPGGLFWAPLAPLRDPSHVVSAVAQALGVDEEGGSDVPQAIASAITEDTLLLVDNCEHVLDAAATVVSSLTDSSEKLRVLATSREPLSLRGERVIPVDPLERSDAVDLFQARATAAGASPADSGVVAELCARLDNLPLAIELAAARTAALPPALLLERLAQRLDLLRGPRDVDERQRTLRTTISWSYDLLTAAEQQLFRRVSVFAGGATLTSLEDIAGADIDELASLVAKSLVRMTSTAQGARYWMLETIREFAGERLAETDEGEPLRRRYVAAFTELAREAGAVRSAPLTAVSLERLEAELANLRLAFALAREGAGDEVVVLGTALGALHVVRGRSGEAYDALCAAIVRAVDPLPASKLRRLLGTVHTRRDDIPAAAEALREAESLLGEATNGDQVWWTEWLEVKLAQAHHDYWSANTTGLAQATDELRPYVEEHGTAQQQLDFQHVVFQQAMREEQYSLSDSTEKIARALREMSSAAGEWDGDFQLGFALLWRGKFDEAGKCLARALEEARSVGDVLTETRCLTYGAIVRRKLGDVAGVRAFDAELAKLDDTYSYAGLTAANRAWLALRDGDPEGIERWAAAALADWERVGRAGPTVFQWSARFPLLALAVERGRIEDAAVQAHAMLSDTQQPLAPDVRYALEEALRGESGAAYAHAIEVARAYGYT